MRARLARYALWQLRDYVFSRGLPTLVVAGIMLLPLALAARDWGSQVSPADLARVARGALTETFKVLAFIIVLLGANGIVANDRKSGIYRLLFAQPVSAPHYYAQSFVVHLVGGLLATLAIVALFAAIVHPVGAGGAVSFVLLYWIFLGGILFLASALTQRDWIVVTGIWLVAQLLRDYSPPGGSWQGALVDMLLPPVHLMTPLADALVGTGRLPATLPLPRGDVMDTLAAALWIASWGVGCFLLGLLVLRKRPLA
jgi:ABC-type transport system involved in multi-copper enzyme maturation permease subunit